MKLNFIKIKTNNINKRVLCYCCGGFFIVVRVRDSDKIKLLLFHIIPMSRNK